MLSEWSTWVGVFWSDKRMTWNVTDSLIESYLTVIYHVQSAQLCKTIMLLMLHYEDNCMTVTTPRFPLNYRKLRISASML